MTRRSTRGVVGLLITACLLALLGASLVPADAAKAPDPTPTTPVLSMRRLPQVMFGAAADAKYAAAIDSYLGRTAGSSCSVITMNGRVVQSRSASGTFAPASTIKLLTGLAAIEILGADHTFSTTAVAAKEPSDGVVEGDLHLVGEGDPLLTTKGYTVSLEDPDQLTEDFAAVADAIVDAGVTEIRGSIIGDDSRFERTRWLPGWPTRYQIGGTVAPLSALIVNDGQTGFTDSPDAENTARKPGDPPALAAATLRTLLVQRGVKVTGTSSAGTTPSGAHEIARFESRPVHEIVGEMLTDSDNTTAELLTRAIGLAVSGSGTTNAGTAAIVDRIRALGLPADGLVMKDGSGLDPEDRATCNLLLAAVSRLTTTGDLVDRLPVAGRTGTLRKRLQASPATGKVRAKTGTLNNVNALAGLAEPPNGGQLRFAMIENGYDTRGTGVTDGFAEKVVAYGDGLKIQPYLPRPIG